MAYPTASPAASETADAPSATGPATTGIAPISSPDAPVRVEVAMPRALFDRLTEHDGAPRCRYDERFKMGEFVAEPGITHEGPTTETSLLFGRITDALADVGHLVSWRSVGALRLLSDDGAFEPDASFYLDPAAVRAVRAVEDYLDVRLGFPPPDLVVEIDRSRRSRHKLVPYFRMGVKEAWTTSRGEVACIWVPDRDSDDGFRLSPESRVWPGITRHDLNRLLFLRDPVARARLSRLLARRVAARIAARPRAG